MSMDSSLNELFLNKVSSAEGRDAAATHAGTFIRDHLRELSYFRKLIPPQKVKKQDCRPSLTSDTLSKIVEIEPRSSAMPMTFRGRPEARLVRGQRIEAAFHTISSMVYQKTEQELQAYEMPVTQIIEDNIIKDMAEIEDREGTIHVEACVQFLQAEANGGTAKALNFDAVKNGTTAEFAIRKGELARNCGGNTDTVYPGQRKDLIDLVKMLDGRRLKSHTFLFTEVDWDDLLQWTVEDNGSKLQSETTVDGYKYNTLLGRAYVRTIKTDILRPGNIYVFTKPDFFGKFFVLNEPKFYIDKIANMISMQAWEDISLAFINVAAVRKLELYSGDANPVTNSDGLLASFTPVSVDNLGALVNRVDAGGYFPNVSQY